MFKNTIKKMKERRRQVRQYILLIILRERIDRLPYWRKGELEKYIEGDDSAR